MKTYVQMRMRPRMAFRIHSIELLSSRSDDMVLISSERPNEDDGLIMKNIKWVKDNGVQVGGYITTECIEKNQAVNEIEYVPSEIFEQEYVDTEENYAIENKLKQFSLF